MTKRCENCRYYIVSEYKARYGGCVIGCGNTTAKDFRSCYEPKNKNKKEKK